MAAFSSSDYEQMRSSPEKEYKTKYKKLRGIVYDNENG
jgi:hypothetical protein